MFRSYSDHLHGAYIFLVKVSDTKICYKCKSQCGDAAACCRITTLTVTFLTNFKLSNFNKEHISSLKMI